MPRRTSTYPPPYRIRKRRWKFWAVTVPIGLFVCVPVALLGDAADALLGKIRRWEGRR